MLHTKCAACHQPVPFTNVAAWHGSKALCSDACAQTVAGTPVTPPETLRSQARLCIARARRANDQLAALEFLADDRRNAAAKIIGLTKSGRRRKRNLNEDAQEFQLKADDARYTFEAELTKLGCDLMGLRETVPAVVEPLVGLVRDYPACAGRPHADGQLGQIDGALVGAPGATAMRLELAEEASRRAERHVDGIFVAESERIESGGEQAVWLIKGEAAWQAIEKVEHIDGSVELHGPDGVLASLSASDDNQALIFGWVREKRPDLRDAERAMTAFEAIMMPGCGLLVAAVVGGGITFGLAYFDAPNLLVGIVGAIAGLGSLAPVGWGVMRLAQRPIVKQLVSSGTPLGDAPAGYRVSPSHANPS